MANRAKAINKTYDHAVGDLGADARWFLACCLSNMSTAIEALNGAGFATYCPTIEVLKPPPLRKLKPSQRPYAYLLAQPTKEVLFPGYFLVGLGATRDHHEIFRVCRIDGLRCADGRPVRVDQRFLDRMRAIETNGSIPGDAPLRLLLEPGDLVRLLTGPCTGLVGTVETVGEVSLAKLDESTRLWIVLNILGGETRVETTVGAVVKVSQ